MRTVCARACGADGDIRVTRPKTSWSIDPTQDLAKMFESFHESYGRQIAEEGLRSLARSLGPRMVTLYDPYGHPIYVPSTEIKIGATINVKTPARFQADC